MELRRQRKAFTPLLESWEQIHLDQYKTSFYVLLLTGSTVLRHVKILMDLRKLKSKNVTKIQSEEIVSLNDVIGN
jgi:hypothetical protein